MRNVDQQHYDLVCVGNALLELTVRASDSQLKELDLPKGRMILADDSMIDRVLNDCPTAPEAIVPAGAECNVATGWQRLAGNAFFAGKVGNDSEGVFYERSLRDLGLHASLAKGEGRTGRIVSFVTPDKQRTMLTSLGDAQTYTVNELSLPALKQTKTAFLSAFSFQLERTRATAFRVANLVRAAGVPLAFDLADALVIRDIPSVIAELIENYAQIVFANKDEIDAVEQILKTDAVKYLCQHADTVVVKQGSEGALVYDHNRTHVQAAIRTDVVDTTGAGDAFAAGFLLARSRGFGLEVCSRFGAEVAAAAIGQFGSLLRGDLGGLSLGPMNMAL